MIFGKMLNLFGITYPDPILKSLTNMGRESTKLCDDHVIMSNGMKLTHTMIKIISIIRNDDLEKKIDFNNISNNDIDACTYFLKTYTAKDTNTNTYPNRYERNK